VYIRFRPSKKQAILVGDRFGIYRDRGLSQPSIEPRPSYRIHERIIGEVEVTSTGHNLATLLFSTATLKSKRRQDLSLHSQVPRNCAFQDAHDAHGVQFSLLLLEKDFLNETSSLEMTLCLLTEAMPRNEGRDAVQHIPASASCDRSPFFHRWVNTPTGM
jgi:hypothetical protein